MGLPSGFYGITDDRYGCVESALKLLEFGAKIIQYRCKRLTDKEMFEQALKIRKLTREKGVLFIVDDRADIALAVEADGVHVGDKDLPPCVIRKFAPEGFIIGLSTHSLEDVKNAGCCDYIGVGPVFPTTTKEKPHKPLGVELAREMVKASRVPAYLIGGITLENIDLISDIGAKGFVSVSDVLEHDREHFKEMLRRWNS